MNATVLSDTGPLYALADPSDQFHGRASVELAALGRRGFLVAAGYPVLCETHTLALRRLGGGYARQWLAQMLDGALLLNPEPAGYSFAATQLERFPDHSITLVDAVTATMSLRLEIPVWSFDRHFVTLRVRLWRPPSR